LNKKKEKKNRDQGIKKEIGNAKKKTERNKVTKTGYGEPVLVNYVWSR